MSILLYESYATLEELIELVYRVSKSFATPDKPTIYAIIDIRIEAVTLAAPAYPKYIEVLRDSVILAHIGRLYDTVAVIYTPNLKWIRIVVPLPRNVTVSLRLEYDWYTSANGRMVTWMDDFKIISKNL